MRHSKRSRKEKVPLNIEVGANTGGTGEGASGDEKRDNHTLNNDDPYFIPYQLHLPQMMAIVTM